MSVSLLVSMYVCKFLYAGSVCVGMYLCMFAFMVNSICVSAMLVCDLV